MSDQHEAGTVDERMAQIEGRMEALLEVVAVQAATIESLEHQLGTRPAPVPTPGVAPVEPTKPVEAVAVDRTMGRRRLLLGGATATAAAAAAVVAGSASPAAAANGGTLILGQSNDATAETALVYGGSNTTGFRVQGPSTAALVAGTQTGNGPAIKGTGTSGSGVEGKSTSGTGAVGTSSSEVGVKGSGPYAGVLGESSGFGVYGKSASGTAVVAESTSGNGVLANSTNGTAVNAVTTNGTAVSASGPTSLFLASYDGRPAPILDDGSHSAGEVVYANDEVWLCVASGVPGTWRKLGGPATAGQLHVLPAPARVYDSRAGNTPGSVGPKSPFAGNTIRVFDLKVNSSGVPAGATAALVTILLVDAATSNGNLTIWANGVAKPVANTMVWGGSAQRFTATAVTALDAAAKVQVHASAATNLVLDVVGYYR